MESRLEVSYLGAPPTAKRKPRDSALARPAREPARTAHEPARAAHERSRTAREPIRAGHEPLAV